MWKKNGMGRAEGEGKEGQGWKGKWRTAATRGNDALTGVERDKDLTNTRRSRFR